MRNVLVWTSVLVSVALYASCTEPKAQASAQTDTTSATEAAVMKFSETSYDFGAIQEGAVITHTFAFTNTGKTPLTIENAVASCGCTVPDWPRTPIAPGSEGAIKVEFNSRGKAGPQQKTITIYANTQPRESMVMLVGTVNATQQPN